MNFEEYKAWREHVLASHEVPSENRFDCLNPFKAMDFSRNWGNGEYPLQGNIERASFAWKELHFGNLWRTELHFEPTRGVRSALGALFERMQERGMELWLPMDVYPFYKQEATTRAPGLAIRYFKTIPEVDLSEIGTASESAALLITDPLSPSGRFLSRKERSKLASWTKAGGNRWVLFDSVYLYAWRPPQHFVDGMEEARFVHLFSMSKSWLLRGVFGFAVGNDEPGAWWKGLDLEPAREACTSAIEALTLDPSMPDTQRKIFNSEWARREQKLAKYGGNVGDAGSGYFRRVRVNFEKAFKEDGLLLVPVSVFGSSENDWSIATCLYEAASRPKG
ncbi:aminotransferase class I/II-fold pyridoxal phosphate-dependent enzyme [Sinorhizobium meliloti]|nr:aminotransferase class I/II-fold pyridoxal phosphate-dependent enzyme [Sinorhizobium meliloti]